MKSFKEYITELFDKPHDLEDVTHRFDGDQFKDLGFDRHKVYKAKNDKDHSHFLMAHRDGAWEPHHFTHDVDGEEINNAKLNSKFPPVKFVSTMHKAIKEKLDNGERVRILATDVHHDSYKKLATKIAKKHNFEVTNSKISKYDHGYGPLKQFYIQPKQSKMFKTI